MVLLRKDRVVVGFDGGVGIGIGKGENVGIVLQGLRFDDYNVVDVSVLILLRRISRAVSISKVGRMNKRKEEERRMVAKEAKIIIRSVTALRAPIIAFTFVPGSKPKARLKL